MGDIKTAIIRWRSGGSPIDWGNVATPCCLTNGQLAERTDPDGMMAANRL